mgnify:CR=1 FL=1
MNLRQMCTCMHRITMIWHNQACNKMNVGIWALKHTCKYSFVDFHDYEHHWCYLKGNWGLKFTCMFGYWKYGAYMRFEGMSLNYTKEVLNTFRMWSWFWAIDIILLVYSWCIMYLHVWEPKLWVLDIWRSNLSSRTSPGKPRILEVRSRGGTAARA